MTLPAARTAIAGAESSQPSSYNGSGGQIIPNPDSVNARLDVQEATGRNGGPKTRPNPLKNMWLRDGHE